MLASFTCPGYVENPTVDFQDFLEIIDSTQLCPDCQVIRTSRSRHCSVCNHCVERFDHHCPWLNNCIGVRNHNYFIIYIISQFAILCIALPQSLHAIFEYADGDRNRNEDYFVFSLGFSKDEFWFYFLTSGVVIITGFFLIPLLILVYVQLGNFCVGKTMLERYSRSAQGSDNIT